MSTYRHIWACVYMRVHIHVCMRTDACAYVHTRKHTCTLYTPRHIHAHTDTCAYVSMHALRMYLFMRMCARIYRCEYVSVCICTCVYAHVRALSLSLSLSLSLPPFSLSLSLFLSVSLSLPLPPSLRLLSCQSSSATWLSCLVVLFHFVSGFTSKSYVFIDLAVVM